MASRSSRRGAWLASSALLVAALTACSGAKKDDGAPAGLPSPGPGKVAAFDLSALSEKYDLNGTLAATWGLVTTDRAGNVYLTDRLEDPEIYRMTPRGVVSKYLRAVSPVSTAMVVRADGSLVLDDSTAPAESFTVMNRNGSSTSLTLPPELQDTEPIGERPDGSLVVSGGHDIWSLKGGRATRLYHRSKDVSSVVVDWSGTVYAVPGNLDDVVVIPVGKAPYHVHPSGTVPGSNTPIASLGITELTPASLGGFYALTENPANTEWSVVYVKGSRATPLADFHIHHNCPPGKQYPAFHNTCEPQMKIAQSGTRVLLVGNLSTMTLKHPQPALALRAVTS